MDELSNELEVTSVLVKRAISYWVSNGVMKEISKNVFKILETEEEIVVDVDNGKYKYIYILIIIFIIIFIV